MAGAIAQRAIGLKAGITRGSASATEINSFRIVAILERLSLHFRPGTQTDPVELCTLCLSLARGIDYAIANNDVPSRVQELPSLLKQIYHRKSDYQIQAAVMVLMISVKNACKNGWFLVQDADELLTLANEMGKKFCSPADINIEPSSLPHIMSSVMSRFFPRMKIGRILSSLEVKPGFGAFAVDFHITREKVPSPQEKIHLFVVQTDNMLTSSCLISPQKVNFLLNGKGVDKRINVSLDTGPQLPSNVTTMLKYGTNLLQAVGHFNGNCLIAIAFVTLITASDMPLLQDYVQPVASSLDSDSEITEGSSRISLNCPISFTRIKVPVKGQFCKHHQCFDFANYIDINSRRPSWRCPHCNQSVCYVDIRVDRNMVRVLREVAGNVFDVVISADGSWKPVMDIKNQIDENQDKTLGNDQDGSGQCESTKSAADVVDLTMENAEENDAMYTCETEDRKPFKDVLPGYFVDRLPMSANINNTSEVAQNPFSQIEDDFFAGIFLPCSSTVPMSTAPGTSGPPATNSIMTPVLTDAVSPSFSREIVDVLGSSHASSSMTQTPSFASVGLQLQPSEVGNSIVYRDFGGRSLGNVSRTPIAVQALPVQNQVPAVHSRSRANMNFLMSNGAVASQTTDGFTNSEAERHQQFSRALLNSPSAPEMSPSSMLHYSMAQNWDHQGRYTQSPVQQIVGLPATSQVPSSYRGSSAPPHNQPPLNVGMAQTMSQPTAVQRGAQGTTGLDAGATNSQNRLMASGHRSSQVARLPPAVPVQLQAPRAGSSLPMTVDGLRTSMGEQRVTSTGPVSRAEPLNELPEQTWRPTARMRGSLSGRAYSAALNQLLIQPTHSPPVATPAPQLQGFDGGINIINSHGSAQQGYPRSGNMGTRQ